MSALVLASSKPPKSSLVLIIHPLSNGGEGDIHVKMNPHSTFERLYDRLAEQYNLKEKDGYALTFNGKPIFETETPDSLGLKQEDILEFYKAKHKLLDLSEG